MNSKQKSLIILQRKAMKTLYPEDVLMGWRNEIKNCEVVSEANSLYKAMLERAVNAEDGSYGVKPSYHGDHEPIIRTRVK